MFLALATRMLGRPVRLVFRRVGMGVGGGADQHGVDVALVESSDPLWAERDGIGAAVGLAVDSRELVVTTVTHARPDLRESSPEPSLWPLVSALAVGATFIGSIFTPWAVVWGASWRA
jgi:hypothetical protein